MASLLPFSLPKPNIIRACSSSSATTFATPETLDEKFGRKGIKFLESDNVPVVELTVRNGSSVRLRIPDAHVTSYKPKVYWKDDGFEEVLYTIPAAGADSTKAKGGIGLVINDISEPGSKGSLLSTSKWTVKDVDSDSIEALQVELSCTCGTLGISYVVSLYPLSMATAVIVKNNGRKPVTLTNAIQSYFRFKRRGGAAIQGLRGCSYCTHPPLSSPFEILSPVDAMKAESPGWFSFGSEPEDKPGSWTLQDVPFTILKNKFSRVYAAPPKERLKAFFNTPPSKYETLDQIELINSDSENMAEVKYIVSLQEDILSSEILVSNSRFSPLQLKGSIVSHLTVSSPDATYAVGLQGSNFVNRPPFLSSFGIVPPDWGPKNEFGFGKLWDQKALKGLLSGWSPRNQNTADATESIQREREDEVEGEEDGNYMHLKEQLSRIYTTAPRHFTVIDRGRRSSVVIGRDGFDELYMFSPGSSHECYSTYSYVCVGQSNLLKPIILGPQEEWRGLQHLHNPNL